MKMLCIYADYKSDESYTPSKISVRVGNNFHNLQEVRVTPLSSSSDRTAGCLSSSVTLVFCRPAAAGDGGAQRLDPHLAPQSGTNSLGSRSSQN